MKYTDSLRGYGYLINQRDSFICQYCGIDGKSAFAVWLTLSIDHLLPKGHLQRDNPEYIVTSCAFCNVADNQYFRHAAQRGISFDGKSREQLVAQRLPYVLDVRKRYEQFWQDNVNNLSREEES